MPVTITFRFNEEDRPHEVALDDLKAQIASGEIGPKALVCDRVLTNGEWWSLDNLNLFHTYNPAYCEAGTHLRKKQWAQKEKEYAEKVQSDWKRKVVASLPASFMTDCLGFEPFEKILSNPETTGVARLIRYPAFGGPDGVTIIFMQSKAVVSTAASAMDPQTKLIAPTIDQVGSEIPDWTLAAKKFSTDEVTKTERHLPFRSLCPPLNNWTDTKSAAQLAPDCMIHVFDGNMFSHCASERGWRMSSTWRNPCPDRTPVQAKLVKAYELLLTRRF
jgi:hypothetical protein